MRPHRGNGTRPEPGFLRGMWRQYRHIRTCARRSDLGDRPCKSETTTTAQNADANGPTCGQHNVTMTVRTAALVTCRRTRVKMRRRATMNSIALLNDAFRTTFSGGKVMMTAGVNALPDMVKAAALQKVAEF